MAQEPTEPISYENWCLIHNDIFEQHHFPVKKLGQLLYQKLISDTFDSNLYFSIDVQSDPTLLYTPQENLPGLKPFSDVFLCDHCWSPKPNDFYSEWKSNKELRERLAMYTQDYAENVETEEVTLESALSKCQGKNLELDDLELTEITSLNLPKLFPELETLSLWDNQVSNSDELIAVLKELPNLRALWIQSNPINSEEGIKEKILAACPKLEIFNSKFTENYTEWSILYISGFPAPEKLAILDLSDREVPFFKKEVFAQFKNVVKADFSGNSISLKNILDYLPNLKSIICDDEFVAEIPKEIVFINNVDPETGDQSISVSNRVWDHVQAAGDRWGLGDEVSLSIHQSLKPNCACMPCGSPKNYFTYFVFWPIEELQQYEEITCNFYPMINFGNFTEEELNQPKELLPMKNLTSKFKSSVSTKFPIKVYTDIKTFKDNLHSSKFEIVETPQEADLQWIVFQNTSDFEYFYKNHVFHNQIEGEKYTTIKDIMYETVTSYLGEVPWLPKTFILSEAEDVQQFLQYDKELKKRHESSAWIVKAFNQTRATFMIVTDSTSEVLRNASINPRLVQRYLSNPLLIYGLKFDLRFIVLLKSVHPFELYAYKVFWPRLAPKRWALDELDDYERHFTVMNYRSPDKVTHKTYIDFIEEFAKEYKNITWAEVEKRIYSVIRSLFLCGCQKMVASPYTKAMYGIDVMIDNDFQPVILECNFQPDCKRACNLCPTFVDDVFEVLYVEQPVTNDKVVQIS